MYRSTPLFLLSAFTALLVSCGDSDPTEVLIEEPMDSALVVAGFEVVRGDTLSSSTSSYTVVANCPTGKVAISGGGSQGSFGWYADESRPSDDGNSWQVRYVLDVSSGSAGGIGEAWAVCATAVNSTAITDIEVVQGAVVNGNNAAFTATADCPSGKSVLGGGGSQSDSGWYLADTHPQATGTGWQVQYVPDLVGPSGTGMGEAWAVCATVSDATKSGYEVVKGATVSEGASVFRAITDCPAGKSAVGGGASQNALGWFVDDVAPKSDGSGWGVQYAPSIDGMPADGSGEAWAVCMDLDTSAAADEIGTVRGFVTAAATGAVVEGAAVSIEGSEPVKQSVTAADGSYEIDKIKVGNVTVNASAAGYSDFSGAVTINDATPVSFDIVLQPLTFAIGDVGPGGGLVFSVDAAGTTGLEVSPVSVGARIWCNPRSDIAGLDNVATASVRDINSGAINTPLIVAACDAGSAADLASSYTWPGGTSDGFLPNKDELELLLQQKSVVSAGGFTATGYWSSTEFASGSAWVVDFFPAPITSQPDSVLQVHTGKEVAYDVRAVRGFSVP